MRRPITQRNFKFLENYSPIPYLIRCYYRTPKDTFLELAPNESIAMLLDQYQQRDRHGTQIIKITQALDSQDLHRWMKQLCLATAGLEGIGLCHEDIRPRNMLLDANRDLRLSDLDRGMNMGEDIAVLTEPFGRLLDQEDDVGASTYDNQALRQRPLPSTLSTTHFYVVTSLVRLNLGVEIISSS